MTKSFFLFATLTVCVLLSSMLTGENNQIIKNGSRLYLSGELIVKLKNEQSIDHLKSQITRQFKLSGKSGMIVAKQIFGNQKKSADLNRIFSLSFNSAIDPLIISRKFAANNLVEWIEPRYVYEVSTVPNDPSYSSQWGLVKVKAAEAWDVTQGDTSVIIGIVDTGIDWDHPDLNANIWVNKTEIAGNGIDDDNNGYIDDNIGWDFGGLTGLADNNPMEDKPDHGTHVAGIASAVTNNGTGVAGMGYKCKLMAVKTSQDNYRNNSGSPYIVFGFEGIVYAVDNGCKVVNCSWGGYSYSHYGQSVADYAALHNVLIVAAAGNDNSSETHYPSGYTGILSVASSGSSDMKSSFSNYGISVDVTAPGESIFNTWMNNTYANLSGTSMAAPLTAGLAGLVAAKFPAYSAKQIGERIRVTCTNIESINPSYAKVLGRGRINAYDAVSLTNLTSIRAE
ncbi:MAG: S8 family serine peptidase [Ignavibacteriales bacterium]|nr:S8 family serine peptidase [Ignavibacteriales bacterium]